MTISEAKNSIGKPFKLSWVKPKSGLAANFDKIKSVDPSGWVHGEWLSAPAEDCRLKGEVPPGLARAKESIK